MFYFLFLYFTNPPPPPKKKNKNKNRPKNSPKHHQTSQRIYWFRRNFDAPQVLPLLLLLLLLPSFFTLLIPPSENCFVNVPLMVMWEEMFTMPICMFSAILLSFAQKNPDLKPKFVLFFRLFFIFIYLFFFVRLSSSFIPSVAHNTIFPFPFSFFIGSFDAFVVRSLDGNGRLRARPIPSDDASSIIYC